MLELEFQRRAFDFMTFFVAQLQLHFVTDQPSVELELAAFVTEHLRQYRISPR